jgi:glycine/D-amino acid oxidase-like deaminating enzyme
MIAPKSAVRDAAPRPAKKPLQVLVVGGSIAGISAGNALLRAGCEVTILERASAMYPAGAGGYGWGRWQLPNLGGPPPSPLLSVPSATASRCRCRRRPALPGDPARVGHGRAAGPAELQPAGAAGAQLALAGAAGHAHTQPL